MSQTEHNTRSDSAHARSEIQNTTSQCEPGENTRVRHDPDQRKIAQSLRSHLSEPIDLSPDQLADFLVSVEASFPLLREILGDSAPFAMSEGIRALDDPALPRQQRIVHTIGTFLRTEFPGVSSQYGIVYTPVEIVDFILHSVNDVLQKEFGRSLSDEDVDVYDLFAGCGTFLARMYELGMATPREGIRGCEIDLFSFFVSLWNLRSTTGVFDHNVMLGDAFQQQFTDAESKIRVFIGNPPYSSGRKSTGGVHPSQKYPVLTSRIRETYMQDSAAQSKTMLSDSYVRAMRLVSDLVAASDGGIVGFIVNGSWLQTHSFDGFRKHLAKDFSSIYVFNLRGNRRKSGELLKKEGERIFPGVRVSPAITLLVKNPDCHADTATIYYHDIGDYLSRKEKFEKIKSFASVGNPEMEWEILHPNAAGDWINHRNPVFATYYPLGDKKGDESEKAVFVPYYSRGVATSRDAWCYNSARTELRKNIQQSIAFYNSQVEAFSKAKISHPQLKVEDFVTYDSTKFSWDRQQKQDIATGRKYSYQKQSERVGLYRPYFKQQMYFSRQMNNGVYRLPQLFPISETENRVICTSSIGDTKEFTALITDLIPDLHCVGTSQCFPLYYYESTSPTTKTHDTTQSSLFAEAAQEEEEPCYTRKDGISDFIYHKAQNQYADTSITKEDIFYYVYGFLHSKEYRQTFANDLKKMLARIPLVTKKEDFLAFSRCGRELAELHLHYEDAVPYSDVEITGTKSQNFRVQKMRFVTKGDKSRIQYNAFITISGIPAKAYEYIINGKSAIEWIMERYAVTRDDDSDIVNDANDWAEEHGNPRYILDLLLSVITVSMKTMEIVESLPRLVFA